MNLPILTSAQMRAAEEAAFAQGVEVEALMDKAGAGVAQAVTKFFRKPGKCSIDVFRLRHLELPRDAVVDPDATQS